MRVKLGELRRLIREAKSDAKTQQVVQQVMDAAETYVDSVVAGNPDKHSAEQLRSSSEIVTGYAKWLLSHREMNAEPVAMVAKYAADLAELSDFWKRPTFLGKQEYVEKLRAILTRMQRKQVEALS